MRLRISMLVSPYWCANAMASSVVMPISSVIALMRDLSQWLRAHRVEWRTPRRLLREVHAWS